MKLQPTTGSLERKALVRVVVEPAAGLAPQIARPDHVFEQGGRGVAALPELLVQRRQNRMGDIESADAHQLERSHGMRAAELHGRIDVLWGAGALLVHAP